MKVSRIQLSITLTILAAIVVAFSTGCVMQQGITLKADQTGSAHTELSVDDFFVAVLEDFTPFIPGKGDQSIMDASVEGVMKELGKTQRASHAIMQKNGPNSYSITFDFDSLQQILFELGSQQDQTLIKLENGTTTTLSFNLDLENYPQLTKIVPFLADPNFETFGPLYNEGMSAADYLEMISYILGEDGPQAITDSLITLEFTTPSDIKSAKGGIQENLRTIRFEIPLIDILLLADPISFSVTW